MTIRAELHRAGGLLRSTDLMQRGYSAHAITSACAAGTVTRPARGWIALPNADRELVLAAQRGMVLTCVSLARRRDLWVRRPAGLHLATRSPKQHAPRGAHRVHWGAAIVRREPFAIIDSIENALNYVATCQPPEEALAIWESALHSGLVSRPALARLPFRGAARRLLERCSTHSGSGVETYVLQRLQRLRLHVVPQAIVRGRPVDFLIERCVILEIDGATHTGRQRDRDNLNDVIEALDGYFCIRVSYRQVFEDWPEVQRLVMMAVAQAQLVRGQGVRA
ncbi:type IV toxin-antitoxin system AbiEi family antitoxin domain-containing protein [Leucobacter chromiiresistens]|uniref:Uncharacterized protein n=1 Tax=Leucobacter chromiiresistens TaxID=1079994 RepID=A0A147EHD4_9MICO|nr:type IV toxin-antitoxin system AbiEi family antitoxin domain-containing protein [Leucobacter chromiiresistens]KTR83674.1 hypothetical protein NS354_10275 [Leucobacter chromiiresistens]